MILGMWGIIRVAWLLLKWTLLGKGNERSTSRVPVLINRTLVESTRLLSRAKRFLLVLFLVRLFLVDPPLAALLLRLLRFPFLRVRVRVLVEGIDGSFTYNELTFTFIAKASVAMRTSPPLTEIFRVV